MSWEIILCEVKSNGYLDKIEKEKIEWIKTNLKIPVICAYKDYPEKNINLKPSKRKKMEIKYAEN